MIISLTPSPSPSLLLSLSLFPHSPSVPSSPLLTSRYAIDQAAKALAHAAGNFYINDKPTGAVVNQQPFGGSRASGTNDKAGSMQNLLRWMTVRSIKETFVPPTDYRYPFLAPDA